SRWFGSKLVWLKTDHTYPGLSGAPPAVARRLGEILVAKNVLTASQIEWALANKTVGMRLGEILVASGMLNEAQLYQALSLQASVPLGAIDPKRVRRSVARSLPIHVVEKCRVMPFQVSGGFMFVVSPDIPRPALLETLKRFTHLQVRL